MYHILCLSISKDSFLFNGDLLDRVKSHITGRKQQVAVEGRSCNTQLLQVYHGIGECLDKGFETYVINLDFSKAFDSVLHSLLIHKLRFFLFNGD